MLDILGAISYIIIGFFVARFVLSDEDNGEKVSPITFLMAVLFWPILMVLIILVVIVEIVLVYRYCIKNQVSCEEALEQLMKKLEDEIQKDKEEENYYYDNHNDNNQDNYKSHKGNFFDGK